jgi:hypothetical protein
VASAVRAAIAKDYELTFEGGTLDVTFPCDGLGPAIKEIVIEAGEGHGGSLEMWRATRTKNRFEVRGIVYQGAAMTSAAKPHEIATGNIAAPDLERVRAALAAKVREIEPKRNPNTISFPSMSFSSRDFHLVIRLTDDAGRVLERRYTGYSGSQGQDVFAGLVVAQQELAAITAIPATKVATSDADRKLFAERFNAAVPHFDDEYFWWVMERYVDLARELGTNATIAGLLTRLVVAKPDRSKVDARADALDALARITGWDARPGNTVEEAASAYLSGCK